MTIIGVKGGIGRATQKMASRGKATAEKAYTAAADTVNIAHQKIKPKANQSSEFVKKYSKIAWDFMKKTYNTVKEFVVNMFNKIKGKPKAATDKIREEFPGIIYNK